MLERGFASFFLAIHASPATYDSLDVVGRAGPAHGEQPFFRLRRRHARERTDLRVGDLGACEGTGETGERGQRAGDAHPLSSGTQVETHAPAQPGRARAEPVVPSAPRIEVADELEQPRRGGVQMGGQLGDLVTETIELGDRLGGGNEASRRTFHGVALWRKRTPRYGTALRGGRRADFGRVLSSCSRAGVRASPALDDPLVMFTESERDRDAWHSADAVKSGYFHTVKRAARPGVADLRG